MRPEDRRLVRGLARSLFTVAFAGAWVLAAADVLITDSRAQGEQKPYTIKDGKVDKATYNGWRRYTESCLRCHGPDGAGSSYAPNLSDSLKQLSEDQFKEIVVNGRQNVTTSNENIMPPFGLAEDVMLYLDDIYAYLKARSDGALGRGRPERIDQ
jgi:methanol metabolism-related c-type cytochrome